MKKVVLVLFFAVLTLLGHDENLILEEVSLSSKHTSVAKSAVLQIFSQAKDIIRQNCNYNRSCCKQIKKYLHSQQKNLLEEEQLLKFVLLKQSVCLSCSLNFHSVVIAAKEES